MLMILLFLLIIIAFTKAYVECHLMYTCYVLRKKNMKRILPEIEIDFVQKVVEVKADGMVSTRKINRRHLLKSSGKYKSLKNIPFPLLSSSFYFYRGFNPKFRLFC